VLADTGECLNSALTQAHQVLRKFGCREVVILPADLPDSPRLKSTAWCAPAEAAALRLPRTLPGGHECALPRVTASVSFSIWAHSRRLHLEEAARTG